MPPLDVVENATEAAPATPFAAVPCAEPVAEAVAVGDALAAELLLAAAVGDAVPLEESDRCFLLTESRVTPQTWAAEPCAAPPGLAH